MPLMLEDHKYRMIKMIFFILSSRASLPDHGKRALKWPSSCASLNAIPITKLLKKAVDMINIHISSQISLPFAYSYPLYSSLLLFNLFLFLISIAGMTIYYPVVRIYHSILYTWISVRVNESVKKGRITFNPQDWEKPLGGVNLPRGLRSCY